MLGEIEGHDSKGLTDAEKNAIREQLGRLLANPFFSHSKRLPGFLQFVVEQTLKGEAKYLKERTLGIEIFGRDAGYDTASDPIVRVTAAEIRKRVAQYYQDSAHERELRISLPSGSYIPHFIWPKSGSDSSFPALDSVAPKHAEQSAIPKKWSQRHLPLIVVLLCLVSALLAGGGILVWQRSHQSPFGSFWKPVLASNEPVLLCIADHLQSDLDFKLRDASEPSRQIELKDNLTSIDIDDTNATVRIAGFLQSHGKQYTLKREGATSLNDLRQGPTVFIGAYDNVWTLRLTRSLRYHFANDTEMNHLWIVDSSASGQSRWVFDRGMLKATNNCRDYAIVARFTDSNTGKLAIVVAGVGAGGTRAAGEFLTDNADLALLDDAARAAGGKKNMEVVLSMQIIDGQPGSAKIEAVYFW